MKFEVFRDGKAIMGTDDVGCIYDDAILTDMTKAGYKFRIDGKSASLSAIKELKIKEMEKDV